MNNTMFDYSQAASREKVPQVVLSQIVEEAKQEFPLDEMMQELHILRAIKSYAARVKRVAS